MTSASASEACALRFIILFRAVRSRRCMPGVSTNSSCACGPVATPTTRWRVVCGRLVTMLTLRPTSALTSVDLPTLGRPTTATKPQRNLAHSSSCASIDAAAACSAARRLLPARALGASASTRHSDRELLVVILALDGSTRYTGSGRPLACSAPATGSSGP
jgi:hypothetical protein